MPLIGLLQGIGPIMGFNHGMRQYNRIWQTLWTGIGLGSIFAVIMFAIMQIFPEAAASLFLDPASPTMAVCAQGLRIQILFLPVLPISILSTAYFQSTAQGGKGLLISALRQLLLIMAVMVLPVYWQLTGVWMALPFAEITMIFMSLIMLAADRKARKRTVLASAA